MDYSDRQQVSQYNEAKFQIIRLHNHWIKADLYSNNGNFPRWKFILDTIWRELYADVKKNPKSKEWVEENKELKSQIANSKTKSHIYESLNDRHEFLKYIQDKVGKGSRYADEDSEDAE